jgi:ABC-type branched-subunit amino acid transport system ATPase component
LLTLSGAQAGTVGPAGGGGTTVINVSTSADPNQVVAAIQQWVRSNGAVPMTTTTAIRR